jgi:hypothetical protein
MATLNPNGNPIRVGTVTLRTPGLMGEAKYHIPGSDGLRAAELVTKELENALNNTYVQSQETIEISDAQVVDVGSVPARTTSYDEPAIELDVPDPGEQWGQFVLYTDESGVTTWHLPRDASNNVDVTRGGEKRTYLIPRTVATPSDQPQTRGLVGAVGTKILKVLVFPLLDPLIGRVGDFFVQKWEKKKRPYRIRTFTPENYRAPEAPPLTPQAWESLSRGRALLMVHGTFSRTDAAFGELPPEYVQTIGQKYEGRVFSFDHPTLSEDPNQNAKWFVGNVPENASLELDIICHSRGGLVSRVLAERQSSLPIGSRQIAVQKVIFVATPNGGTILTDTKHVGDFIDTYTNLLNFFPSTGVTDVLEAIITVVKQLAVATAKGLPGLQSMLPGGDFLRSLNTGQKDEKQYYALASNFEPTDPGLKAYAENRLMDAIFEKADNDLVVPTAGVYDKNGSGFFPIPVNELQVFAAADGIPHTGFFSNAIAREKILGWLSA